MQADLAAQKLAGMVVYEFVRHKASTWNTKVNVYSLRLSYLRLSNRARTLLGVLVVESNMISFLKIEL